MYRSRDDGVEVQNDDARNAISGLQQLTALRHLALAGSFVQDYRKIPGALAFLSCLSELRHLDLSGSLMRSAELERIGKLTLLEYLDVMNTGMDSLTPLSQLTALRHLNVRKTELGQVN